MSRPRIHLALPALAAFLVAASAAAQDSPTTVILVRHAEKAALPADDPPLTPTGEARARELAAVLADTRIAAVYSTPYVRTRRTAEAVAHPLGMDVRITPITDGVDAHARDVALRILREHPGQTVLVVGHSNTIPVIARALGTADPGPIGDNDYDDLLIVLIGPNARRDLIRARY